MLNKFTDTYKIMQKYNYFLDKNKQNNTKYRQFKIQTDISCFNIDNCNPN